jgi:hypothetical protein
MRLSVGTEPRNRRFYLSGLSVGVKIEDHWQCPFRSSIIRGLLKIGTVIAVSRKDQSPGCLKG